MGKDAAVVSKVVLLDSGAVVELLTVGAAVTVALVLLDRGLAVVRTN